MFKIIHHKQQNKLYLGNGNLCQLHFEFPGYRHENRHPHLNNKNKKKNKHNHLNTYNCQIFVKSFISHKNIIVN